MNRGAVVGFLVLAALVGSTASLRDQDLAAIGERLLAIQSTIETGSTYSPLPRLQTANARLAFLDYQSSSDFDVPSDYNYYQAQAWDDPYSYDPGPQIQPQTFQYFDVPADQYYDAGDPDNIGIYTTPSSGAYPTYDWGGDPDGYGVMVMPQGGEYPTYDWGGDPDGYGVLVTPSGTEYPSYDWGDPDNIGVMVNPVGGEYPSYNWGDPDDYGVLVTPNGQPYPIESYGWGDPDNYGTVVAPSGSAYPQIDLSRAGTVGERSAAAARAGGRTASAGTESVPSYQPAIYQIDSYTPAAYLVSGGNNQVYQPQPTWYESAFPGWGSAVVPLLPTQYRPGYGNDCYYNNYNNSGVLSSIMGGLSVSDNGFGVSLGLGFGGNNYPCYGNSGYLGVAPTYYDAAGGSGNSRIRPTCSISLADSSIEYGRSAVISWSSQNATGASLNGVGSVSLSGTRSLANQTASRTIGITVTGPGGTGACYAALSVNTNQPPSCQISANPSVIKKGETANLAWVSSNATEASLSGLGTVPVQSGRVVSPASDTTFTLRVKNAANLTATCSVKIDVQ